MSGVTPLVDTLLATRLGQRVDLVPLKAQVEIAGPGAVANVEKVDNDVRLPSREALQRELGVGLAGRDGGPLVFAHARTGGNVSLSAAARAVSAILNLPVGTTPAVRGQEPLQADMGPPAPTALKVALARTVAESGLFYESHLRQYAAGLRTLGQLAREPQAGISFPSSPSPPAAKAVPPQAGLSVPLAVAGAMVSPGSVAVLPGDAAALLSAALEAPETTAPPAAGGTSAPAPESPLPSSAAAAAATTYGRTGLPDPAPSSPHDFSLQDSGSTPLEAASDPAARAGHPAAAIHPDAVGLVRQQLEMLAVPVFRWSGEGWPGIPMDWEIRQERDQQERREGCPDDDGLETTPAAWTTRMTLKFPRLGTVEVRLGLAGETLQLRLSASQEGTAAVLNQARAGLPQRFGAVGLELTDLQIGGAQRKAAAAPSTGEGHAG